MVAQEAPKKKYVVIKPHKRADEKFTHAWREVKVAWPTCEQCQDGTDAQWFLRCQHNPYIDDIREDVVTPLIKCAQDGTEIPAGTFACPECHTQDFVQEGETLKPRFIPQLKTRGVRIDPTANSGRSMEVARAKGAKLPTEMGFASMCEFSRCYNPVMDADGKMLRTAISTPWGLYCSESEAKLVALASGEESIEIFHAGKQAQQLQNISLPR